MLRRALIRATPAAVAFVGGVVIAAVAGNSPVLVIVGLMLAGLGAVALVSLVFYEVGLSEDRERDREHRERERPDHDREDQKRKRMDERAAPGSTSSPHPTQRRRLERRPPARRRRGSDRRPPHRG